MHNSVVARWSREQEKALDDAWRWVKDRSGDQVFRIIGNAGTGKSTLATEIGGMVRNVAYVCLAGKAVSRLVERGAPRSQASTIHRLIYKPVYDEARDEYVTVRRNRHDLANLDLIVCDEASMVGTRVARDLLSFRRPVLVVGDDFQLPPPTDEKIAALLQGRADAVLREVHRQALDNPILAVATAIRQGKDWRRYVDDDVVRVVDYLRTEDNAALPEVFICGTNQRRRSINRIMRAHLGYDDAVPHTGEVVVCLKNDYGENVYNGETFEVCGVRPLRECPAVDLDLTNLQYPAKATVRVPLSFFESGVSPARGEVPWPWQNFDYGYALTAHKSQGSEWGNVAVLDESKVFRDMAPRWLYTAVTRARERLTLVRWGVR